MEVSGIFILLFLLAICLIIKIIPLIFIVFIICLIVKAVFGGNNTCEKHYISEKCNTNTPPTNVSKEPPHNKE